MKKLSGIAMSLFLGASVAHATPTKAVVNVGKKLKAGVYQLDSTIQNQLRSTKSMIRGTWNKSRGQMQVAVRGDSPVAWGLYKYLISTTKGLAVAAINSRESLERDFVLALAGDALLGVVSTATGFTKDAFDAIPGANVVTFELDAYAGALSSAIVNTVRDTGILVLGNTYDIARDTLNTVEEIFTLKANPLAAIPKLAVRSVVTVVETGVGITKNVAKGTGQVLKSSGGVVCKGAKAVGRGIKKCFGCKAPPEEICPLPQK